MFEVRANLSFGTFRQGRIYQVDEHDPVVRSLIGAGYLAPMYAGEVADGRSDNGGNGVVPDGGVVVAETEAEDHISLPKSRKVTRRVHRETQLRQEGSGGAEGGAASGSEDS